MKSKSVFNHSEKVKKMKQISKVAVIMALMVVSITANAQNKKAQQAAIKNTENIANLIITWLDVPLGSLENSAFMLPLPSDFWFVEQSGLSFNPRVLSPVSPGTYQFSVYRLKTVQAAPVNASAPVGGGFSVGVEFTPTMDMKGMEIPIEAVLEEGKYYQIIMEMKGIKRALNFEDSTNVFMREVTDMKLLEQIKNAVEPTKKYLSWYHSFSDALEGTYKTKNGKSHITFKGNRFQCTLNPPGGIAAVYEGTYLFDKETLILRCELMKSLGIIQKYDAIEVRHYTLNNGVLNVFTNKFVERLFLKKEKYYKTPYIENIDFMSK